MRLVNIERAKNGLPTLSTDERLASIARAHSLDMLANNYFSHTNKSGCDPACRLRNAGYAWTNYGENIYMEWGYGRTLPEYAAAAVASWMKSAGHRANILGTRFTVGGVGVAKSGTRLYFTQLFALPR